MSILSYDRIVSRGISDDRQALTQEYIDGVDVEAADLADSTTEDTPTKSDPPPRTTKKTAATTRQPPKTAKSTKKMAAAARIESAARRAKSMFEAMGSDSSEDEKDSEIKRLKRELDELRSRRAGSACKFT